MHKPGPPATIEVEKVAPVLIPMESTGASGILGRVGMAVICPSCAVGYHWECAYPTEDGQCHCTVAVTETVIINEDTTEVKERGGQIKSLASVTDLESTGRKRAAKLYPIPKEGEPGYPMVCEWAGLAAAGGGVIPIIGCFDGLAKAIHHGPDKNTLSNFVGNVHRICATCHNRWHTINDKYYSGERPPGNTPYLPLSEYDFVNHSTDKATKELMAASEVAWATKSAADFLHNLHQSNKLNPLPE